MCLWWLCCRSSKKNSKVQSGWASSNSTKQEALVAAADPQEQQDYEDLQHLAQKREIKVTIRKGTQAGVAAGLSVMTGVIVAGPVGAVLGGAIGTAMAARIAKNVVSLNDLLEDTPPEKRRQVIQVFHESFKEEFLDTIQNNPELRLLIGGMSIFGVLRYMVDRNVMQNDQLEKLDGILKHVI
mmetsp:Transcript_2916/g.4722  ORF Transcript_2916/g.4722 Transcript_2916/m.4722 type:complete len:183 (+) Transcript_2916:84-632(+)|eukprot:CAMPEP_0119014118 /NCGR_PEP_ID=MMETSP1176-20130426/9365_1 /TAXON_ID=265551 /ORGANISM="Synedropsis recta cf, Strain CCMP1620" /LENGTH=182 /DNA_ID=CAMNT_0006967259 /DNA_START=84 /DNA_END=632 /DNA_ORIENTATION=+